MLEFTNNNCILDDSNRGITCSLRDLDGFPLGQTDGFPVDASAGVLVGNPRNTPTNTTTEMDLNLGTSPFDCFAFQMHEITFYELKLWHLEVVQNIGFH